MNNDYSHSCAWLDLEKSPWYTANSNHKNNLTKYLKHLHTAENNF